jgi:hypothetical protein
MQKDTLRAFLLDEIFREKLKSIYNLKEKDIDNISMTSTENIPELIVIKEMINKQTDDRLTSNIIAGQINNLLDNRLKKEHHENT